MKKERKMIVLEVSFWTDFEKKGARVRIPGHAWAGGTVQTRRSKLHKINPTKPKVFNSLLDLGHAVEKALLDAGVTLHHTRSMNRYMHK